MTSPNDVAALVERGADAMEALVHVAGTLGREGDKDSEDTIKDLAGILAATIAALQAEVERAKEDERDRLYRKANADYIEAEERGDAIAQEWHSAAAGWLGHNGGKSEDDRAIARSASRKETTP